MKITIEAENDAERAACDAGGLSHVRTIPLVFDFALFGNSASGPLSCSHGDHEYLECMTDWMKRLLARVATEERRKAIHKGE